MGFLGDAWDAGSDVWDAGKDAFDEYRTNNLFAPVGGGVVWQNKGAIGGAVGGGLAGGPTGAMAGFQAGRMVDGKLNDLEGLNGGKGSAGGGANFTPAQQQSIEMRNRYADALSGYQSQGSPFIQTTTKAPAAPKPAAAGGMTDEERRAYLAALSGRGRAF